MVVKNEDGASRPPTLKEIARLTGAHVSTVSRVLRQSTPPDGWSETATRIRETAEQLGYKPNPWAASLRTRRTQVLGVVMPRLHDGVIASMFTGIQQAAMNANYSVIMSSPDDNSEQMRAAAELMTGQHIDGLILSSVHAPGDDFIASLNQPGVPIVLMNRHAESSLPSITTDDVGGGRLAAKHLVELGHRRIGIVAGPEHATTASDRVLGFVAGLKEHGITIAPDAIVHSGFEVAGGVEAGRALLSMQERPTAIFAVNDTAAIGVMGVARDFGLSVPNDLSVAGFNDIPIVSQLPVPLTTIRSQSQNMGTIAVQELLKLISGEEATSHTLNVELVSRASTAPPQHALDVS